MTQRPLWGYVLATALVWAVILICIWIWYPAKFREVAIFCGGFYIGMLAMFIAVHIYRWQ